MAPEGAASLLPVRRTVIIVLDGWGLAPDGPGNAISQARTPVFDKLWSRYPQLVWTRQAARWDCRTIRWATPRSDT